MTIDGNRGCLMMLLLKAMFVFGACMCRYLFIRLYPDVYSYYAQYWATDVAPLRFPPFVSICIFWQDNFSLV